MKDLIKEVVLVQGKDLDYIAIVYLENGTRPKAICRVRFPRSATIIGFRDALDLEALKVLMRRQSRAIADTYGYEMTVLPMPVHLDSDRFIEVLREAHREWRMERPQRVLH